MPLPGTGTHLYFNRSWQLWVVISVDLLIHPWCQLLVWGPVVWIPRIPLWKGLLLRGILRIPNHQPKPPINHQLMVQNQKRNRQTPPSNWNPYPYHFKNNTMTIFFEEKFPLSFFPQFLLGEFHHTSSCIGRSWKADLCHLNSRFFNSA